MINDIITELYAKNIPMKILNKLKKELPCTDDVQDYVQEMYLILLEYSNDKIIDLYKQGELDNYFARICINQLANPKSKLHKKLQLNWDKINIDKFLDYELKED